MNESERKHTPLPWAWDNPLIHVDLNQDTIAHICLSSETNSGAVLMAGVGVGYLVYDDERTNGVLRAYIEVEPADAEFIVLACNNHYRLRDALRTVLLRLDMEPVDAVFPCSGMREDIRAALATTETNADEC